MRPGVRPRAAAMVAVLAALLLAGCGDDTSGGQPAGSSGGGGSGSALVSPAQADQGARQWWSDHEQALARRDATALTRLDADPGALVIVEELRVSLATGQPIIAQPRQPTGIRVYVPAQQSWPVPILAVFDVAAGGSGGAASHLAVLLVERSAGAPLVALETATLDAREPQLDVDGAGYARAIAPTDQAATLGHSATDLSGLFGRYMGDLANGAVAPSPVPFADGPHTSELAQRDATFIEHAAAHSTGSVGSVQFGYLELNFPTPVFAVQGGGGFTLFAVQRNETLLPVQGQAFLQDQSRRNYGVDLAPGQYSQIAVHSIMVVALRMPPAGAPMQALGVGGGVYSAG